MKTFNFAYHTVVIEGVGYLTKGFGVGFRSGEYSVTISVDGKELTEWYDTWNDANERYLEVKRILERK